MVITPPARLALRGATTSRCSPRSEPGTPSRAAASRAGSFPSVRWFLRDRTCLVLEANHDELLLRRSGYPPVVQQRIAGSGGHLSNLDAARLLEDVHHEALATVVVAHMSLRCNTVEAARNVILPALAARGFRGGLIFAEQDGPMAAIPLHPPHQATLFG